MAVPAAAAAAPYASSALLRWLLLRAARLAIWVDLRRDVPRYVQLLDTGNLQRVPRGTPLRRKRMFRMTAWALRPRSRGTQRCRRSTKSCAPRFVLAALSPLTFLS